MAGTDLLALGLQRDHFLIGIAHLVFGNGGLDALFHIDLIEQAFLKHRDTRLDVGPCRDTSLFRSFGDQLLVDKALNQLRKQRLQRHLLILRGQALIKQGDVTGSDRLPIDSCDDGFVVGLHHSGWLRCRGLRGGALY